MFGLDPGTDESLGGLCLEELGHKVEALVYKTESIEHHRLYGLSDRDDALIEVLGDSLVDSLADLKLIEHSGNQTEVIENFALVMLQHVTPAQGLNLYRSENIKLT